MFSPSIASLRSPETESTPTRTHSRVRPFAARLVFLPALLFGVVVLADVLNDALPWSILSGGIFDDSAHIATAGVLLLALLGPARALRERAFSLSTLLMSVLVDLDHAPMYLGLHVEVSPGGRPFTHTLLTPLFLLLLVLLTRGRTQKVVLGLLAGLVFHFYRDLSEGPGLALLWPHSLHNFTVPYPLFLTGLASLALFATLRSLLDARR